MNDRDGEENVDNRAWQIVKEYFLFLFFLFFYFLFLNLIFYRRDLVVQFSAVMIRTIE